MVFVLPDGQAKQKATMMAIKPITIKRVSTKPTIDKAIPV